MKNLVKYTAIGLTVLALFVFSSTTFAGNKDYSIYGDSIYGESEKTEKASD